MLTDDAKRIYTLLKQEGLEGLRKLEPGDREKIVRGNRKLFAVERQVADPETHIIETKFVIDWKVITDEFIIDTLKEHGVV